MKRSQAFDKNQGNQYSQNRHKMFHSHQPQGAKAPKSVSVVAYYTGEDGKARILVLEKSVLAYQRIYAHIFQIELDGTPYRHGNKNYKPRADETWQSDLRKKFCLPEGGHPTFPGGRVAYGVAPKLAAAKEFFEELGNIFQTKSKDDIEKFKTLIVAHLNDFTNDGPEYPYYLLNLDAESLQEIKVLLTTGTALQQENVRLAAFEREVKECIDRNNMEGLKILLRREEQNIKDDKMEMHQLKWVEIDAFESAMNIVNADYISEQIQQLFKILEQIPSCRNIRDNNIDVFYISKSIGNMEIEFTEFMKKQSIAFKVKDLPDAFKKFMDSKHNIEESEVKGSKGIAP